MLELIGIFTLVLQKSEVDAVNSANSLLKNLNFVSWNHGLWVYTHLWPIYKEIFLKAMLEILLKVCLR